MKDCFQIKENYDVSFTNFFEGLFLSPLADRVVELYEEYYGIEIPRELIEKTKSVFTESWKFLLKRSIKKEEIETWKIKNLSKLVKNNKKRFFIELHDVINNVEKIHRKNWDRFSKDRKEFIKLVQELIEKYGDVIAEKIEEITRTPWQVDRITIYPVFDIKHRSIGDCLLLAFPRKKDINKNIIRTLIHEAIHVNTLPIWKKYRKKEDLINANEIATHIITSLVIKNINQKFNEDLLFEPKAKKLKTLFGRDVSEEASKIWKNTEKLENICKKSENFEDFLFKVHDFLKKIKYRSFYEGVSGKNYSKMFEE